MRIYREAALKIQLWYRQDMCERRYFLRLRKAAITIQVKYREIYAHKIAAAIMIQKTFRMYLMRREFVLEVRSAVSIQRWFRSKKERIMYLRLKRSLPHVQKKCVEYVKKRNDAATLIQKAYRMYKFRRQMNLYRKAAVCIQKWHRNMSLRYEYIKKEENHLPDPASLPSNLHGKTPISRYSHPKLLAHIQGEKRAARAQRSSSNPSSRRSPSTLAQHLCHQNPSSLARLPSA